VLFCALAALRFVQPASGGGGPAAVPAAQVAAWSRLMRAGALVAKPKVKRPEGVMIEPGPAMPALENIFSSPGPGGPQDPSLASLFGKWGSVRSEAGEAKPGPPPDDDRKLCYLVDCSGSMQGIFGRVRRRLEAAIEALRPDQYFSVVFFGGGRINELADGRLVRATPQAKRQAAAFIGLSRPAGGTNALEALETVIGLRDASGRPPAVVYFLTDGFELTGPDREEFSRRVTELFAQKAPTTRINTVGFWPQPNDRLMLEAIAARSGGQSVFVTREDSSLW
jgi:hypothetical protein